MNSKLRVACWMSEKKLIKFNWPEFEKLCEDNGIETFQLDLSKDLEPQGPFSVLIHKLTDIFTLADQGDQKSITIVKNIQDYLARNPSIIVIDPLPNVYQLLDRYKCYTLIQNLNHQKPNVFIPNFCEITEHDPDKIKAQLQQANVSYPFICKPIVGHGSLAHDMLIVFNEKSLKDCKPPSVAQSFVNHNGVLYKIFVVGDAIHICERPSLKNFKACEEQDTIFFDSTLISKVGGKNSLTVLDPEDEKTEKIAPDLEVLKRVGQDLREVFGLDLFGVDIVIESTTGRYAVIDVNSFPGYDGFQNLLPALIECIKSKIAGQLKSQ